MHSDQEKHERGLRDQGRTLNKGLGKNAANNSTVYSKCTELLACEKGSTELMGMGSTAEDFGTKEEMTPKVDATACHAIVSRTGVGRVRHLDVRRLWIQEKAQKGNIRCMRVSRQGHVVDSFTKAETNPEMGAALKKLNLSRPRGRPAAAPQLNSFADARWQGCRTGTDTGQCAQWQRWPKQRR